MRGLAYYFFLNVDLFVEHINKLMLVKCSTGYLVHGRY